MYCVAKIEPRRDFRLNEALQSPDTAGDLVYIMHGHIGTTLLSPFLFLFCGRAPAVLEQTGTAWKARADLGVEGGGTGTDRFTHRHDYKYAQSCAAH